MKIIIKTIILSFLAQGLLFANAFAPEYYKNQVEILRTLDIESSFIGDPVFVEAKSELKKLHSKTLVISAENNYEFIPVLRQIINEQDLPKEFLYLAIVESGLKTHSTSRTKAIGVWQFMENTAKSLDLRVDPYIDERKDVFKSTLAAANYLKSLKAEFGKWYLAILAYNCGNGKLRQAIKEAGSDDLSILLDADKKYIPLETRVFIRKILTLAFLANNEDFVFEQNSAFANYSLSHEFSKVRVPQSVSLRDLAKLADLDFAEFRRYNPHFRYDFTPPNGEVFVYLPLSKSESFSQKLDTTKLAKVDTTIPKTQIYIVKSGDSLYSIAKKYKISVASIRAYNKIKKNHLSIKQKLVIPIPKQEYNYAKTQNKTTAKLVSR